MSVCKHFLGFTTAVIVLFNFGNEQNDLEIQGDERQ